MAVTAAVAKVTPHSISLLLSQDGAAGTTLAITNAVLQAGFGTVVGPMRTLLSTAITGLSTAIARSRMLGDASGLASQNMRAIDHSTAKLVARTLVGAGWLVDADTDAVSPTLPELNVTGPAGASTCLLTLHFQHSMVR